MLKRILRSRILMCLLAVCVTSLLATAQVTTTFSSAPTNVDWADATVGLGPSPSMATRNDGDNPNLIATYASNTQRRSLLKINIANMIPIGTSIQSAKLVLRYSSTGNTGANALYLQRVTQAWQESAVTWNNQPTTTAANQIAVPSWTSGLTNPIEIDVTAMVQDMLNNPETNFGFMMRLQNETVAGNCGLFSSDYQFNSSYRPKLIVVTAQAISTAQAQRDYVFGALNQADINTGILADYGLDLANPALYDGVIRTNNEMTIDSWRALLGEFLSATINPSSNLKSLKVVNDTLDNKWRNSDPTSRVIDVPVQFVRYQALRTDAITQNLIMSSDNRLFDVPGRVQSPYTTNYAFAAAPTMTYDADGRATFRFPASAFINSSDKSVTDFSVDFDDGAGFRSITLNTPVDIQYLSVGTKTLRFKLTVNGGNIYNSHSKFQVYNAYAAHARYATASSWSFKFPRTSDGSCPEPSFPNPEQYDGSAYGATVTVAYGSQPAGSRAALSCSPQFIKPLIVVEGFDVHKFSAFGTNNWSFQNFNETNNNGGIRSATSMGDDLNGKLDQAGYDIIFIDFYEGTGDIIRNAYLVENVVKWVNAHKITNPTNSLREKNVVLGQSMGGLVARYALCDLEKRRIANNSFPEHECEMFISQDSPHRGANVPLGFQSLINKLATQNLTTIGLFTYGSTGAIVGSFLDMQDLVPALKQGKQLLNEPATKQMLIIQDGQTNTFLDGAYRTMVTLPPGHAPSFSMHAISNGSECGHGQKINASAELFYADASLFISPLLFVPAADILSAAQNIPAAQGGLGALTDVPLQLLIPFTGKTWKTNITVRSTDTNGSGQVFSGKFSVEKKILFLIPITITLFESSTSVSNIGFWDSRPGGFYNLQTKTAKISGVDINAYPILQANLKIRIAPLFNFVPTVSALDVSTTPLTTAAITSVYTGGSNATYPSRFANFKTQERNDAPALLGSSYNSRHVQFTRANTTWLLNVLAKTNPVANCTYACSGGSGATISGPETLCSDPVVYSLSNIPPNNTILWGATGEISVPLNASTPTVTMTPAAGSGEAIIRATFNSITCGETSATKTVSFVNPVWPQESMNNDGTPSYIYQGPNAIFVAQQESYITWNDYPAKTGPITVYAQGNVIQSGPGYVVVVFPMPGTYTVSAEAPAPCGYISVNQIVTVVSGFSRIAGSEYAYYPNPASEELTIAADPTLQNDAKSIATTAGKGPVNVVLTNSTGNAVRNGTSDDGSRITLDTTDLPNGLYYLILSTSEKTYSQSIVISH